MFATISFLLINNKSKKRFFHHSIVLNNIIKYIVAALPLPPLCLTSFPFQYNCTLTAIHLTYHIHTTCLYIFYCIKRNNI
ncbi:recombinase RecQ [Bacillus mycoides]|nr:recombinase RecQ [Bacillus mycoides]